MTNPELAKHYNWQTLATYVDDHDGPGVLGRKVRKDPRHVEEDVLKYFKDLYLADTKDEVISDYLDSAKRYAQAKFAITNWRNYLNTFRGRVHGLERLKGVSKKDREKLVEVLAEMSMRMPVEIGGRTENRGGRINVARTVADEGEGTALFALFHEIGHGVQTESDIPTAAKDAIYINEKVSGTRFGELFADAFSVIVLNAVGRSQKQILKGAENALAGHPVDGDHPTWSDREKSIKDVLANK